MQQTSIVKRTRESKIAAGSASLAMKMAKDNNDQLYKKSQKFKKLFLSAKKAVMSKYGSRARAEYIRKSTNGSSGNSQEPKK